MPTVTDVPVKSASSERAGILADPQRGRRERRLFAVREQEQSAVVREAERAGERLAERAVGRHRELALADERALRVVRREADRRAHGGNDLRGGDEARRRKLRDLARAQIGQTASFESQAESEAADASAGIWRMNERSGARP